jgi:hypothetical protein
MVAISAGYEWLVYLKRCPQVCGCVPASNQAAIAQLGERQTEDLKVPSSILGLGTFVGQYICEFGRTFRCSRFSCGTDSSATE